MPTPTDSPGRRAAVAVVVVHMLAIGAAQAHAEAASPWFDAYNSRVRLIAGNEAGKTYAGIDIEMAPGWKTYWRHPGDAGGVPPNFDWTKSTNLLSAVVLYPAPKRLKDPAGDAIGYASRVVFPARVVAADPASKVKLAVQIEYGICKDICVPVETLLELELLAPPDGALPAELAAALDLVPRIAVGRRTSDPSVVRTEARLDGDKPHLLLEVEFPPGSEGVDVFIEAPDGIYVPQPQPSGVAMGQRRTFEVDLATGVDPADLRGKKLTLTMVGSVGRAQAFWQLD